MDDKMITEEAGAIKILCVSTLKQDAEGNSPQQQSEQIDVKAAQFSQIINAKIIFEETFEFKQSRSGDIDTQPILKAIEYCKQNPQIEYAFVRSIDRFTRGGVEVYLPLKQKFLQLGVQLIDCYGQIGTHAQEINTLGHLGIEYKWSKFNPYHVSELLASVQSKDEVRGILTRMIGAEIKYVRDGYTVGPAPFGFQNARIDTPHGRRVTLEAHPLESKWIIRMFELKAQGNMSDEEIVSEINGIGYKSRIIRKHDKLDPKMIIGTRGGVKLTVKQMDVYFANPAYAGVSTHVWKKGQPLTKSFPGLVSLELWNAVNYGKKYIVEDGATVKIVKGKIPEYRTKKDKNNPLFPYKAYVLCPVCQHQNGLYGSAPKNGNGVPAPRYHCNRKHKYWEVNNGDFDKTLHKFVKQLHFSDRFRQRFKEIMIEEYEKRRNRLIDDNIDFTSRIAEIEHEQKSLGETIEKLVNIKVIRMMEDKIEKLDFEREHLLQEKKKKVKEQRKVQTVLRYLYYFMDNVEDLLLGGTDPVLNAQLFGMVFIEKPTYEELQFGTSCIVEKLNSLFQLNEAYKDGKSLSVSRAGQSWNGLQALFLQLYQTFERRNLQVPEYSFLSLSM